MNHAPEVLALRGAALTFVDDPQRVGVQAAMRHESDALVMMAGGRITHFGPANQLLAQVPPGTPVQSNGRDTLMLPGFVDCHVHYPQIGIIGAHGEQLLDWLGDAVGASLDALLALFGGTLLFVPDVTTLPQVPQLWSQMRGIVNVCYVIAIIAGFAIAMTHETLQSQYAVKDIAPRLVFGALLFTAPRLWPSSCAAVEPPQQPESVRPYEGPKLDRLSWPGRSSPAKVPMPQ